MLTRKYLQFMFADAQQKSFQKLNDLLTRAEAFAYFKNEYRTIVADTGSTGSHPAARIHVKSSFLYIKKSDWCGKEIFSGINRRLCVGMSESSSCRLNISLHNTPTTSLTSKRCIVLSNTVGKKE